jgi:hypothetical protein
MTGGQLHNSQDIVEEANQLECPLGERVGARAQIGIVVEEQR